MFKLTLVALAVALASASIEDDFAVYKDVYNKQYTTEGEEMYRLSVYRANKEYIAHHNKLYANGQSTFYLGENEFTDMTNDEFRSAMNGLRVDKELNTMYYESGKLKDVLPDSVDWRKKGYVTPVKNQGQCGSCWAFSAVGSLEGAHFKSTGKLVSLSESNLVDCSQKWGNHGCGGGWMDYAFKYVIDNKGIDTETSYPYKPETRTCRFNKQTVGSTEKSFTDVTSGSEDALQQAIATVGPISVAIDAGHPSFQSYRGGVYNEPNCGSSIRSLDHGVLAVGYGADSGKDYYIVKNSWGTGWGEEGYIRMTRNKDNQCGIATAASYPIV